MKTFELKRTRNTVSTRRRQDNMRKLVDELGKRDMLADEICFFFGYSPSGARKYIRELVDAHIIEVSYNVAGTHMGPAVYSLSPDADHVHAFLALMDDSEMTRPAVRNSGAKGVPESGRNFHIMADDTTYRIKPAVVVCRRDELVTALFGAAGGAA